MLLRLKPKIHIKTPFQNCLKTNSKIHFLNSSRKISNFKKNPTYFTHTFNSSIRPKPNLSRCTILRSSKNTFSFHKKHFMENQNNNNQLEKQTFSIVPVPVLSDNYAYLIIDQVKKVAAAVDPAQAEKVLEAAKQNKVNIESILTTHHHADHSGGNQKLVELLDNPNIKVYGGDDRIPALTNKVGQDDTFQIGSLKAKVHFTPCHTSGHVLFEVSNPNSPEAPISLFTGDTLFVGGCGRFFEGTAEQMYHALYKVVSKLPKDTLLWVGHEYTEKNLLFAHDVEPDNQDLKEKLHSVQQKRSMGVPTIPSTVHSELLTNPFMRVHLESVKKAVGKPDDQDVTTMAALRSQKDSWGVGSKTK